MFFCGECGNEYIKWEGKCRCGLWGTIKQVNDTMLKTKYKSGTKVEHKLAASNDECDIQEDLNCKIEEINRVCRLFKKSTMIIGGEPGIGKSTLMCQIADNIDGKCLYLAGEESTSSVKRRIERVCGACGDNILVVNFFFLEDLEKLILTHGPSLVILDSIHTTRSSDNNLNTPKDMILHINFLARQYNTCFLVVSHITKDGIIAGPKTLEHMVDVVLYLEGDRYGRIRFLRSIKNRFGPTNEAGIFEMTGAGMTEVSNPSALFISNKVQGAAGSVVFCGISGSRPILIEIQALVTDSNFPQVESIGFSPQRLKMILAVLQKWCNIKLFKHDVFVNIVGGMKMQDPAADLPVAMAIVSSFRNRSISAEVCFFGELGLTGEIRQVTDSHMRVKEALRLNFQKIYANLSDPKVTSVDMLCNICKMLG
jgi:DNA repair protein RadA/Sms